MNKKQYYRAIIAAGLLGTVITTVGIIKVMKSDEAVVEPIEYVAATVIEEPQINIQPITDEFDVLKPLNATEEELIKAIDDEFRNGLIPVVDSIIEAEQTYGVNALYLLSTLGLESGWGLYRTGDNNIAGWKTLDGSFRNFESLHECVMTVAKGISTSFKEDIGSSLLAVTTRYCTDYGYLDTLKQIMGEIENRLY